MEKLYTVGKNKTRVDCGSEHELLIAKFRLKLKKVGKTTRSFKYDLNQIPYNYTVEVTNRSKGLDLIDRVPEELWMEVHGIVQKTVIKTIPKRKKYKKAKWLPEKALQIAEKRREAKVKGENERYTHLMQIFKECNHLDFSIDHLVMSMCRVLCCWKRVFAVTRVFSWQNSVSLCPASFCTPRPNLSVTPGIS